MPFQFTCPYCFKKTLVDDSVAGMTGPCVGCGKEVTVPSPRYPTTVPRIAVSDEGLTNLTWVNPILKLLIMVGCVGLAIAAIVWLAWPALQRYKQNRNMMLAMSSASRIAQALNNYAADHGTYPTPVVTDAAGKPLYSWRVLLLPYLGEGALYQRFNLKEAWDSPDNTYVIANLPLAYLSPNSSNMVGLAEPNYMLVTGRGTLFPSSGPLGPNSVVDAKEETILVVEVSNAAISWAQPGDINRNNMNFAAGQNAAGLKVGSEDGTDLSVAMVDGRPEMLPRNIPSSVLNSLLTPDGGEPIPPGWLSNDKN